MYVCQLYEYYTIYNMKNAMNNFNSSSHSFVQFSFWRSEYFFGREVPGIKDFCHVVGWSTLDRNTGSKCNSLCNKLWQVEMSHCDKPSKFSWSEYHIFGWRTVCLLWVGMSQVKSVTTDGLLGGCFVRVEMSPHGQFMGRLTVKVPFRSETW